MSEQCQEGNARAVAALLLRLPAQTAIVPGMEAKCLLLAFPTDCTCILLPRQAAPAKTSKTFACTRAGPESLEGCNFGSGALKTARLRAACTNLSHCMKCAKKVTSGPCLPEIHRDAPGLNVRVAGCSKLDCIVLGPRSDRLICSDNEGAESCHSLHSLGQLLPSQDCIWTAGTDQQVCLGQPSCRSCHDLTQRTKP